MDKKKLLRAIRRTDSLEELEEVLGIPANAGDGIGYRGGSLGFYGSRLADVLGIADELLPRRFGAYCNYLGGGIRGAICSCAGQYNNAIDGIDAEILDEIGDKVKEFYERIENAFSLNDEEDESGEPNWEAMATAGARASGVISAY